MKNLAFLFSFACLLAFSSPNKSVEVGRDRGDSDNADMTGMYYSPDTGVFLFTFARSPTPSSPSNPRNNHLNVRANL